MKLKLFENFNEDELLQVIKDCFQELLDDDKLKESVIKKLIDYKINNKDLFTEKAWVHPPSDKDISKYKITRNYNRHRSTGYYDNKKDIVNTITFAISKDFDVYW